MAEAWIGLFEVVSANAENDVLGGAKGAYVNVVAIADDQDSFEELGRSTLQEYGLRVLALEDTDTVASRRTSGFISKELLGLALSLSNEHPIQFGDFQSYVD